MTTRIVTLLSDFGLKDPYVAEMKAIIATISADVKVIDISHLIDKFNIRIGAFILASATRYFPKGTIHVAVVDPGVGTKRRPLLIETENAFYIGPDNGLLILAAQRDKIKHAYAVTNAKLMLPIVSRTFHGRDVFAPAAAHLANGMSPKDFGVEIKDYVVPRFAKPEAGTETLRGEVLHIDDFGNVITNLTSLDLEKAHVKPLQRLSLKLNNKVHNMLLGQTYGDVTARSALALIGSHGFLELAVNRGDASRMLKIKVGDSVIISSPRRQEQHRLKT